MRTPDFSPASFAIVSHPSLPAAAEEARQIAADLSAVGVTQVAADSLYDDALRQRIQRKYGMTFSRFRGTLQVEEAKRLLCETSLSLADVARRVGIRDSANFRKLFHSIEGMPPSEYRKRFGRK